MLPNEPKLLVAQGGFTAPPHLLQLVHTKGNHPMFKLMLRYNNQGDFIDTVYPPCGYQRACELLKHYRGIWGNVHTYILVEVSS